MKMRTAVLALPLMLFAACGEPTAAPDANLREGILLQKRPGTGLVLNSLTGLTVPLIGAVGDVVIDQAVLTNFALVEDAVGQIIGVEVEGVLQLTGGVLGTDVVTEDFASLVTITSSGPGQCDLVTLDLGPIALDALGLATIDVPVAELTGRGSGAVGSLLCTLGGLLSGLTGGVTGAVQGVLNAVNNLI